MLPIQKMLTKFNHSVRTEKAKYIVIHDVGAVSKAINNAKYFNSANRDASADFFVDSTSIYQIIDYKINYSWSIGDGHGKYGKTNSNTVSMELCLEADHKPSAQTIKNAQDLVRFLMKDLNIPLANVVTHHMCSDKNCPASMNNNGDWSKWIAFHNGIVLPVAPVKPVTSTVKPIIPAIKAVIKTSGVVTATVLNVRESAVVTSRIIGELKKNDKVKIAKKVGNFYEVYFGLHGGFVSADYIK